MAKTYNKMQIDMNGDILSSVTAVAQDTLSRYLDCNLYNNGVAIDLTGHMAQLYVLKEDNTIVVTQGDITDATAGRVQFELTNQTLAVTGWLDLQVVLTSGEGEVLSSEIFQLHVLPSIRNDEAIESTNEFGALVVLFQEIQNSLDLMKKISDSFGEPGEKAEEYGAETFWQMLETLAGRADVEQVIKANVNSTMGTDEFAPIDKLVSSGNTTLQTLIELVNTLKTGNVPVVRHIQRGTFTIGTTSSSTSVTLSGFTDLNKMEVILNGFRTPTSSTDDTTGIIGAPLFNELTLTKLNISCKGSVYSSGSAGGKVDGSYQVIEYY